MSAKLLHGVLRIPDIYFYGTLFLISCVGFFYLTRKTPSAEGTKPEKLQSTVQSASSIIPVQPLANFDATQYFRLAYYSPLTAEVEKNIRLAAAQNQPDDHEGFFAKFIGVGLVGYLQDITWAYIYKSQLLMLMELNRRNGMMPLAEARPYYDKAVADYPQIYADCPFDQWLEFIKVHQLIIKHPSDMLEITVRGKDFLKYLTHWGRYADARKG